MEEIIARKYRVLSGLLNERQSRLWAAESINVGYGGFSLVSRSTGISRVTISHGNRSHPYLSNVLPMKPSIKNQRSRNDNIFMSLWLYHLWKCAHLEP